ncbi:lamin tail domain-containing protein [Haloarcula onubensis]|uniref:Lamin tail domain-containing protein n=1 Tax=Haloarcula onubensis TaxID=2950539 RepID=A0ABU2FN41_9EURY|nr:lamin tail domain-containing protein [Halomicroarcula sp. S3CR25-11]MDS0282177.1 lamin tail domain-containing protein [Halomicroarcula sp. S3CR25-11]
MTGRRVEVVVALVLLAGCGGLVPTGSDGAAPTGTAADVPDDLTRVSVTAVVDGDTIRVEYRNGTRDTVRLVGVDTPEVHTENDPSEFEGVPDTAAGEDCLRSAGINASNFAKDRLLGRSIGIATDPNLDRRGYYDRLLAYVVVDDRLFNYRLVASGRARVYDSEFSRQESFTSAETSAREDRRGLWRCTDPDAADWTTPTATASPSGLALVEIHEDAAGNDNENLNDEYLVFANRGDQSLALSGWTVTDAAGHSYAFGEYSLAPGERVTLHTGSGTDTATARYWGASGAVWNNGGDTVTVRTDGGDVALQRAY